MMRDEPRIGAQAFGGAVHVRRPAFSTRAVHTTSSSRALLRNAVFMSDVTQRSVTPRSVMIASHIATSAAPISVIPLTMPPGRSSAGMKGTRSTHSPGAVDSTRNAYDCRNGVAARTPLRSESVGPDPGHSAVVGSIIRRTAEIRLAGNPPRLACSRTVASSGAI